MPWIGIRIHPFVVVREGEVSLDVAPPVEAYEFGFVTEADIADLIRLEPGANQDEINTWFREGKLCFGVRDKSRLIAKMWCDLDEFNFAPNYRRLSTDEAYLYAAYTDPDYRGQGLAPMMRTAAYASLREIGRSKFYSYTDYFNTAARRFKAKLGAREESLRLHLALFGKWSKVFTLRRLS